MRRKSKIVIIGGGFGGLEAAKKITRRQDIDVTLIDRTNHHTFQPLLYQVATAVLSPGEIASPIRRIFHSTKNIEIILGEVIDLDLEKQSVRLYDNSEISYDYLIVAAGARHSYFGNNSWEMFAPGLKTLEDALEIRRRVLLAFELAEREAYLTGIKKRISFAVIGGGPTGVEVAGAIAGIARQALANDFNLIDTRRASVMLFEGGDRILSTFSPDLSEKAKKQLEDLGVEVYLNNFVTDVEEGRIKVGDRWFSCDVAVWATGVEASPLGKKMGAETDRAGRVFVNPDLTVGKFKNVFVIGDMASLKQQNGEPVPGVVPAAMQMAECAVENILRDLRNQSFKNFEYYDKGSMATIGKTKAIVEIGKIKLSGFIAWLTWLFVHLISLIGFRNRIYVLSGWFWAYLTRERNARLIIGDAEEMRDIFHNGNAETNPKTLSATAGEKIPENIKPKNPQPK